MTRAMKSLSSARAVGATLAICIVSMMSSAHTAEARPYTVYSCDSAGLFGYSSAAWTPFGDLSRAYSACPSAGRATTGISNRLVGQTYAGFSTSGHAFNAPPGATITQVRWAGRMARDNCRWTAHLRAMPSTTGIIGLRNGEYCDSTEFDNRGWPISLATPHGTTSLQQLVICGASTCPPGATMHSQVMEVTVDDPVPPSISLDGPLASRQWVSGRAGHPHVGVTASDNAGLQSVTASIGGGQAVQGFPCTWSAAQ